MTDTSSLAALMLRLGTGTLFIAHGLLKLVVFTPAGTAGYFESIGLPGMLAYLTIVAELGGGVALIAGVYTRLVSLALIPVLLGAAYFGHGSNGWGFSNEGGGWEFPVFWAVVMLALAILGNGVYSVHSFFAKAKPA
ncbi:DoxX family protein [Roseovarius aestuarii]|uniref:Putative oxidoreductase MhqP n=1 Tax=Roseovarius aestuarii TaxID=475083 RepID=A0A1X7BNQ7_9RHOB|nr:DoxX family protein [Roseovarius aestuarii]SMC11221.1 Putative oxidoreductase MhqP [Roseovarius aestuarii]